MRLIDFEYASYNFRSFDHGNHFCEWMFNYENNEAPYYSYNPTNWPTDNQILFYLKHYCKEMEIPLDKTQMLLGTDHQINLLCDVIVTSSASLFDNPFYRNQTVRSRKPHLLVFMVIGSR